MPPNVLHTVLVNPSRYDERGVMVFRWGIGHNGTLASLSGIIEDFNRRHVGQREIRYEIFDEHVTAAVTPERIRQWRDRASANGARFVLMLCGVHTNSYPRGRDIALMARRDNIDVLAGGIHLTCHGPSVEFLASCGVSVCIGECEPFFDRIASDAFAGTLAPLYRIERLEGVQSKTSVSDITAPDLEHVPFPHVSTAYLDRFLGARQISIDSSRGCPFVCTFCAVKNAFGRTVRGREPTELADWIARTYDRDKIQVFGFTDDNFVRNPRHLEVLEAIAKVRAEGRRGFKISLMVDVEGTCFAEEDSKRGEHTRRFLDLAVRAGLGKVCIGLESTSDASLREMKKHVNRARGTSAEDARAELLERYRKAIGALQSRGVRVECSVVLGFDGDDRESGLRTARDMMAIGADIVNFTLITPIPGAEDYANALADHRLLDDDFNDFFYKPLLRHATLSPAELTAIHDDAITTFYSLANIVRRTVGALAGIGRPRTAEPIQFVTRQAGAKIILMFGRWSYFQGGLLRKDREAAPRMATTDEDARRHYLGGRARAARAEVPATMRDDARMDSLPVLNRHFGG